MTRETTLTRAATLLEAAFSFTAFLACRLVNLPAALVDAIERFAHEK